MKKLLGLDYGEKRIGLAISDETGQMAKPYGIILNISQGFAVKKIKEICKKERIGKIIIGLPLNLKGEIERQAEKTKVFAEHLGREVALPIILEDERFTTKEAERILKERSAKSKKGRLDILSAVLILNQHLDRENE
jgi:putative Holliday junction resolvase